MSKVLLNWLKTLVFSISANKKHEQLINDAFKKVREWAYGTSMFIADSPVHNVITADSSAASNVTNTFSSQNKKGIFPALSPMGIPYQSNGCDCGVFTSLYFWAFHSMASRLSFTRRWAQEFQGKNGTQYEISEDKFFESFDQRREVGEWREKMKEECERRKAAWKTKGSSSSTSSSSSAKSAKK